MILVVVEGPLLGLEDYTIEPAVAAHLFSEFGALGFATRPFVSHEDAVSCNPQPDVSTLSQRLGSTATAIEQAPLLVRADAERFKHLVALVETVSHVGNISRCAPLPRRRGDLARR